VNLGQRACGGLDERHRVAGIPLGLAETADLTAELLRDRKAGGIAGGAVDPETGSSPLHRLGCHRRRAHELPVSVERLDVVLNPRRHILPWRTCLMRPFTASVLPVRGAHSRRTRTTVYRSLTARLERSREVRSFEGASRRGGGQMRTLTWPPHRLVITLAGLPARLLAPRLLLLRGARRAATAGGRARPARCACSRRSASTLIRAPAPAKPAPPLPRSLRRAYAPRKGHCSASFSAAARCPSRCGARHESTGARR